MNTANIQKWLALEIESRELAAKAEEISKKMGELEPVIMDEMTSAGIANLKVAVPGSRDFTIYINEQRFPKILDSDGLLVAMKELGLDDYIKTSVNSQSLGKYLREEIDAKRGIPKQLAGIVEMPSKFSLRAKLAQNG